MPVPPGYIDFHKAYVRHYANRFGAAPTPEDVAQANADRHEGLRKEWLLRRDLGLNEDQPVPHRPEELGRWLDFCSRQKLIEDEIVAALKAEELVAYIEPDNPLYITAEEWRDLDKHHALLDLFDSGVVRSPNKTAIKENPGAYKVLGTAPYLKQQKFEEWSRAICGSTSSENAVSHNRSQRQLNKETSGEIWIPFLEAVYRTRSRLSLTEFSAKLLLRAIVDAERVSGRGEFRERGRLIFAISKEGLEQNPDVIAAPGG